MNKHVYDIFELLRMLKVASNLTNLDIIIMRLNHGLSVDMYHGNGSGALEFESLEKTLESVSTIGDSNDE